MSVRLLTRTPQRDTSDDRNLPPRIEAWWRRRYPGAGPWNAPDTMEQPSRLTLPSIACQIRSAC